MLFEQPLDKKMKPKLPDRGDGHGGKADQNR